MAEIDEVAYRVLRNPQVQSMAFVSISLPFHQLLQTCLPLE